MRWFYESLRGLLQTVCPLCEGPSQRRRLCPGCYQDTYGARQNRRVCLCCAQDLCRSELALPARTVVSCRDFRATDAQAAASTQDSCRICRRRSPRHAWLICALDGGFPEALLLKNFLQRRTDLSLVPLLARLMWQSLQMAMQRSPARVHVPDAWVALPADEARLQRCQCNPAQELAAALARCSGRPRLRTAVYARRVTDDGLAWGVKGRLDGCRLGLVVDVPHDMLVLNQAVLALQAAGAAEVGVIAAAKNSALWQNLTHVSCDPR